MKNNLHNQVAYLQANLGRKHETPEEKKIRMNLLKKFKRHFKIKP
jgi:hypothetical protein